MQFNILDSPRSIVWLTLIFVGALGGWVMGEETSQWYTTAALADIRPYTLFVKVDLTERADYTYQGFHFRDKLGKDHYMDTDALNDMLLSLFKGRESPCPINVCGNSKKP